MRFWVRFKHAECFGALLSRKQISTLIPMLLGTSALACVFGSVFVAGMTTPESSGFVLSGCLAAFLGFSVIAQFRYLIGYLRRGSINVPNDLVEKIAPAANWPQLGNHWRFRLLRALAGGSMRGGLWVAVVIAWLIALLVLQGVLSGDFVPGVSPDG